MMLISYRQILIYWTVEELGKALLVVWSIQLRTPAHDLVEDPEINLISNLTLHQIFV